MSMGDEILALVSKIRNVTFAELQQRIPGFGGGNKEYGLGEPSNIVLWAGLTDEAGAALEELRIAHKIYPIPTSPLTYAIDGAILNLPIAKSARQQETALAAGRV